MKTITPPVKNENDNNIVFESDHKQNFIVVKEDLCLVSSIVSYEDPYQNLHEYMIEDNS